LLGLFTVQELGLRIDMDEYDGCDTLKLDFASDLDLARRLSRPVDLARLMSRSKRWKKGKQKEITEQREERGKKLEGCLESAVLGTDNRFFGSKSQWKRPKTVTQKPDGSEESLPEVDPDAEEERPSMPQPWVFDASHQSEPRRGWRCSPKTPYTSCHRMSGPYAPRCGLIQSLITRPKSLSM